MLGHEEEQATIAAIDPVTKMTRMVERLSEQVEALQIESARARHPPVEGSRNRHPKRQEPDYRRYKHQHDHSRAFNGECWRCHQRGHTAQNCTQNSLATGKLATPGVQGQPL